MRGCSYNLTRLLMTTLVAFVLGIMYLGKGTLPTGQATVEDVQSILGKCSKRTR